MTMTAEEQEDEKEENTHLAPGLFTTFDMWFAAYLECGGAKCVRVEEGVGERRRFVLEVDLLSVQEELLRYYNRIGSVEPRSYKERVSDLRDKLRAFNDVQEMIKRNER